VLLYTFGRRLPRAIVTSMKIAAAQYSVSVW
jgi:hypothetical protein